MRTGRLERRRGDEIGKRRDVGGFDARGHQGRYCGMNLAAATEDLRVQNERYRVGAATILDLLTSQTALTTAEQNLVQVRFDYLIARAQVEAVVGRTL